MSTAPRDLSIASVLLADGWHDVNEASFEIADWIGGVPGFSLMTTTALGREVLLTGPLSSILAVVE